MAAIFAVLLTGYVRLAEQILDDPTVADLGIICSCVACRQYFAGTAIDRALIHGKRDAQVGVDAPVLIGHVGLTLWEVGTRSRLRSCVNRPAVPWEVPDEFDRGRVAVRALGGGTGLAATGFVGAVAATPIEHHRNQSEESRPHHVNDTTAVVRSLEALSW